MIREFSLIKEYKWLGEFWFSDTPGNTFPGILSYSPQKGILLSVVKNSCINSESKSSTIHGYTMDTSLVTLIEVCLKKGPKLSLGARSSIQESEYFCSEVIIGKHLKE